MTIQLIITENNHDISINHIIAQHYMHVDSYVSKCVKSGRTFKQTMKDQVEPFEVGRAQSMAASRWWHTVHTFASARTKE